VRLAGRVVALAAIPVLCLAGVAAAHAYLKISDPPEDGTVSALPREIRLTFTEPVEIRFSIFKVYRVEAELGWDLRRLNAAAGTLTSQVLQKRGDEADRADAGLEVSDRTTPAVIMKLKPETKPRSYAALWRVHTIAPHPTQGFYVFTYRPRS
jgi:methionine-rich copper-binding protein CopC